jgi:hypothetical protein
VVSNIEFTLANVFPLPFMPNFNVERVLPVTAVMIRGSYDTTDAKDAQLVDWHVQQEKSKCLYLNLFLPVVMSRLCLR